MHKVHSGLGLQEVYDCMHSGPLIFLRNNYLINERNAILTENSFHDGLRIIYQSITGWFFEKEKKYRGRKYLP
jgi:hypothetical protein